jgi:hypothetical protein
MHLTDLAAFRPGTGGQWMAEGSAPPSLHLWLRLTDEAPLVSVSSMMMLKAELRPCRRGGNAERSGHLRTMKKAVI